MDRHSELGPVLAPDKASGATTRRVVLRAGVAAVGLGAIGIGRLRVPAPVWAPDVARR